MTVIQFYKNNFNAQVSIGQYGIQQRYNNILKKKFFIVFKFGDSPFNDMEFSFSQKGFENCLDYINAELKK
jgi:hypothetical protein